MGKKIVILNGSPRRGGNTDALSARVAEGARNTGAEVEEVFLSELEIHPCTACEACASGVGRCVFEDGMSGVLEKVESADALVFASPVWWFNVSSWLKLAVDRLYPLFMKNREYMRGKKTALVLCYGDADPLAAGAINAYRSFQDIAAYTGAGFAGILHGSAYERGEILKNAPLMKEALNLGSKLGS